MYCVKAGGEWDKEYTARWAVNVMVSMLLNFVRPGCQKGAQRQMKNYQYCKCSFKMPSLCL